MRFFLARLPQGVSWRVLIQLRFNFENQDLRNVANTPRELQNGPGDILKANRFATLRILAAYLYVENITKREDPRA